MEIRLRSHSSVIRLTLTKEQCVYAYCTAYIYTPAVCLHAKRILAFRVYLDYG